MHLPGLGIQGMAGILPTTALSLSTGEYTAFSLTEREEKHSPSGERFKYYRGEEEDIHGFS